jgi:hypothetical protein
LCCCSGITFRNIKKKRALHEIGSDAPIDCEAFTILIIMKQIFLTGKNKHLSLDVSEQDYEKYKDFKWRLHPRGYLITTVKDKNILMKKEDGSNYRIKMDKSIQNKFVSENFQRVKNCQNIYFVFDKYQIWIKNNSSMKFIGCFSKLESAIKAYNRVCEHYQTNPILNY